MDHLEPKARSQLMSRVRSRNTQPEMKLRKALYARGLRYRLHAKELPGKPDIVFRTARIAIFVHGCFWHQHYGCIRAAVPKSNTAFWKKKLNGNVARDCRNREALIAIGYRVITVWECEIKTIEGLRTIVETIAHEVAEGHA
ncbi:very short patch repair endonuclease [Parasphingopyxis marina]|uniref:Very short patch repair endonuclease n=1 Tax=Parasphingopyxis marina TaxID=2761622 RepID=A0A842I035_9SPHN|nr:very short patch repair endonuclease [Parasphingopyxis marina]MBC2777124.1 DNA mismatch endonuclease Vsr [Parasphingopyxis marina]